MKILGLKMHNFGVYANTNFIDLVNEKPVILIGGMNGRGKTTILEAILLSLYGKRSFVIAKNKIAFPQYLDRLINTEDRTYSAWVELEFELSVDDGVTIYLVKREWSRKSTVPTLKTTVMKNGYLDQMLSENWDVFIEGTLPCAIAPFFFFDGEKISELASSDDDEEEMKNSIRSLLGINVIDQAIFDIERIAKDKRKSIRADELSKEVELLEKKVAETDTLVKINKENLAKLEVKRKQLEIKLNKAEDNFLATGGNLAIGRKSLLARKTMLEERLDSVTSAALELTSGDLPLLMVYPMLRKILNNTKQENEQKNIKTILERLPELFRQYADKNCSTFNFDKFLNYVKDSTTSSPLIYNLTDSGIFQLKTLCATLGSRQRTEAQQVIREREIIMGEIAEIESHLAINVNEIDSKRIYENIINFTKDLATVAEQYRIGELALSQCETLYEEAKRARDKTVERAVSNMEVAFDNRRIIIYASYTTKVLSEYKMRLQKAKTRNLAETMTQCFEQLASKRGLITEIKIDPETLEFQYFDGRGIEVNRSNLSAGEKQLLVIAMLWALGICSRKQLPIIIDTPLARLDSFHRKSLVMNYFPLASEQTILLSTDSEIQGQYYDLLKPSLDKTYTLFYDDKSKRSRIEKGYFGSETK